MRKVDQHHQQENSEVHSQVIFVERAEEIKLALEAAKSTQKTSGLIYDVTSSLEKILKDASTLEGELLLEFYKELENTSGDNSSLLQKLLNLKLDVVKYSVEAAALVNPININIEEDFPQADLGQASWITIPKVGRLKCELQYSNVEVFRLFLSFDSNVVVQNVENDHKGSPVLRRVKEDGVECILRAAYNSTTIVVFNGVRHLVKISDVQSSPSKTLSIKVEDN
jgi:hypothetical protein